MPESDTDAETHESIVVAADKLSDRVTELTAKLTLQETHQRSAHRRNIALGVLAVIAIALAVTAVIGWVRVTNLVHQNCANANKIRASSDLVWVWLIDTSIKQNTHASPAEVRQLRQLESYINAVYAPQNCKHPGQTRPQPTPPSIILSPNATPTRSR